MSGLTSGGANEIRGRHSGRAIEGRGLALSELTSFVELLRLEAARDIEVTSQAQYGQFFTPQTISTQLASLFTRHESHVRILDPGAGVGSLFAAVIERLLAGRLKPESIEVTAYEIDSKWLPYLERTVEACSVACNQLGVGFEARLLVEDFVASGAASLEGSLFSTSPRRYTHAVLNPPYKKLAAASATTALLAAHGVSVGNLYTAFLSLASRLVDDEGELVAISPRSFANGPYFESFRKDFLSRMVLTDIHVFEARDKSFDKVLQENIILRATRTTVRPESVRVSSSAGPDDDLPLVRTAPYETVVSPNDPQSVIHIVVDGLAEQVARIMGSFDQTLEHLGLTISTGRVVDFRATSHLSDVRSPSSVPLIHPMNVSFNRIDLARRRAKKAPFLAANSDSMGLLVPRGNYVLVKRFSAKEERRRVVAAVLSDSDVDTDYVGIENHLNYFHSNGRGIDSTLAAGLAAFLNSTFFDDYFRQFSGHTQVNATDLRNVRYPRLDQLETIGRSVSAWEHSQREIDDLLGRELFGVVDRDQASTTLGARRLIKEAETLLHHLGLPKAQQNERSALTLLALLGMKPASSWNEATNPTLGITQMMDYFREQFGKSYAPNTRETVRRYTVHQFIQAGIVVQNPDDPLRAINSPNNVYQIEPTVLALVRSFGSDGWSDALERYGAEATSLREIYKQQRQINRIPVTLSDGTTLTLSPGGQNVLVARIVEDFCSRFAPGGEVLYLGDTESKLLHFDQQALAQLGIKDIEKHGILPDIVVHYKEKGWLLLIEAVTSHGPVTVHRMNELRTLFEGSSAGLVFVTAFLSRADFVKYLADIAWETEVWIAEAPDHMIHFNGERFLGPYETVSRLSPG